MNYNWQMNSCKSKQMRTTDSTAISKCEHIIWWFRLNCWWWFRFNYYIITQNKCKISHLINKSIEVNQSVHFIGEQTEWIDFWCFYQCTKKFKFFVYHLHQKSTTNTTIILISNIQYSASQSTNGFEVFCLLCSLFIINHFIANSK